MNLNLSDDQLMLRETFARLFQNESTAERVRAAEPLGFDQALWQHLIELGVPSMRVPQTSGGAGFSLLDACILAAEAGRYVAAAPVVEVMVASRLLAESEHPAAAQWLKRQIEGTALVSLALHPVAEQAEQLVPAGAVAEAVLCLRGEQLVIVSGETQPLQSNIGDSPVGLWSLDGAQGTASTVLMEGTRALSLYQGAIEEWKLLMSATLVGLGQQALHMAAEYSVERSAFGQAIGSYQGLAHPMADVATDMEGARWLVLKANWSLAQSHADAAVNISMAYWWVNQATSRAVAQALHVYGGYGLSLEYPIQLYHRRAKSWSLVFGDPDLELERLAQRLWDDGAEVALPQAGPVEIDFGYGGEADAFAARAREFFEHNLDEDMRAHAHHSWAGHHPDFQRRLADAGLLLPDWPQEYGGQGRNRYDMIAMAAVFNEVGWTRNAIAVVDMVGKVLLEFGSEQAKTEILPLLTSGEAICCLGFSEPACGSDVFAAQTRAVRNGEDWIINGQKMFTSGAELADYVLLLTRSDPEADKHRGLTMFLVPMNAQGVSVQAIHTLADERTNVTYYDEVRISDDYRLGEVNGGVGVMARSLSNEQDGSWFAWDQRRMVDRAVSWARSTQRNGEPVINSCAARRRLAPMVVNAAVSDVLCRRSLWNAAEKLRDKSAGPMSKLFATESYIRDATELMDLMAPESLLSGVAGVELDYRLSTATSIYAGSSEIMRSLIAENALNMPRTRN